jgi:phosphatidylserine/phosphatidylglycerophosphate/cardiolipin synthase-like enzyme
VVLAEKAQQSIDLQTYIFENDDTGRLVAQALLKAADRGVRVRLLVDDITKGGGFAAAVRGAGGAREHRGAPVQSLQLAQSRHAVQGRADAGGIPPA